MHPLFKKEEILLFCQWSAPAAGIQDITETPQGTQHGRGTAKVRGTTKEIIIIPHERWPMTLGLRSILQIQSLKKRTTWLINGQAGRNAKTLCFSGETGPVLIPSTKKALQAIEDAYLNDHKNVELKRQALQRWNDGPGKRALPDQACVVNHLGYENEEILGGIRDLTTARK